MADLTRESRDIWGKRRLNKLRCIEEPSMLWFSDEKNLSQGQKVNSKNVGVSVPIPERVQR